MIRCSYNPKFLTARTCAGASVRRVCPMKRYWHGTTNSAFAADLNSSSLGRGCRPSNRLRSHITPAFTHSKRKTNTHSPAHAASYK
jgi:hypothetical protein